MKKLLILISTAILSFSIFANPASKINHHVLENGLQVFLLEDSSDALVHINFIVKAGFSSQTQTTNGFFKLYTSLLKSTFSELDNAECSSDFSSYKISISNSQIEKTLSDFSSAAYNLQFSDEELTSTLNLLKNESTENAQNAAGFINAAIDSRVFSGAPWQHDSGIYPPVFKKTTPKFARTILKGISEKYYTPQNSALFISGNFNSERTLTIIKNTFGRYYTAFKTPSSPASQGLNRQRKFVLHHQDFSRDITQVVVQYTTLNMEQSDILASAANRQNSSLKTTLLSNPQLNIPGDEYINAAAAHKKNSSRIIFQSLLQPSAGKTKLSSCKQALDFLQTIQTLQTYLSPMEIQVAKEELFSNFDSIVSNPKSFMENLADFWAIEQYYETKLSNQNSSTISNFLNRKNTINNTNFSDIITSYNSEEPFIFVLISDADYKNSKAEYKAAGFEEINKDNASWYVLQMYKEIKNQLAPDELPLSPVSKNSDDNSYYEINIRQIQKSVLPNGISLTTKKNENTNDVVLLISISGGELFTAHNHGFEEVMINLIATMIQKEIYSKQRQGIILSTPSVTTQTNLCSSSIIISCQKEDFTTVCNAAVNAIIYGEIPPAAADRAVSARKTKKRLENGSAVRQLYAKAISTLYPATDLISVTNATSEILENTNYNSFLKEYPKYLNASRYNLILTGNYEENAVSAVKNAFSTLAKHSEYNGKSFSSDFPKNKVIETKIIHTFLTDIPAEKAGPQPAVLIPTTEFLDPVIFAIKSPAAGTKEAAIFNSILNYLDRLLKTQIGRTSGMEKTTVTIQLPASAVDSGFVIFQNVTDTKEIHALYKQVIQNLKAQMLSKNPNAFIYNEIKNFWTKTQLEQTASNKGTAILMQKGLDFQNQQTPQTDFYLQEYNKIQNAGPQDFIDALSYFPDSPDLRIYSKDSK